MSADLHGNAPDDSPVALLLVDVINDLEFEGGDALVEPSQRIAEVLAQLKSRCRAAKIPTIYVNDNFGRWQSNLQNLTQHCRRDHVRGRPAVERILPADDDYFVLKPKHSGFYATPLSILLQHLGAKTLIIGGLTADRCVLFTANDAYLRDYRLIVPSDGVASIVERDNRAALEHMRRVLKAETPRAAEIDLQALGCA